MGAFCVVRDSSTATVTVAAGSPLMCEGALDKNAHPKCFLSSGHSARFLAVPPTVPAVEAIESSKGSGGREGVGFFR